MLIIRQKAFIQVLNDRTNKRAEQKDPVCHCAGLLKIKHTDGFLFWDVTETFKDLKQSTNF